jgi:glucokinase
MTYAIGIDIGVTNIKSVCVTADGAILSQGAIPTCAEKPDWPERVTEHIQKLQSARGENTVILGLAAPGLASPDESCISWMQGRLGEVEALKWTEFLRWPRAVPILNDAQAALLGEVWKGAAAGARNAVLLTLGTGVGGAILADGKILKGHIGRAGHLGHTSLDPDGIPDVTNCPGSLEVAIGNYTLRDRSGGRFASTHDLVAAHRAGDAQAGAIWDCSVKALAAAVASFINIVDPEVVIIGGGIAVAGELLFEPLRKYLDQFEWRPHGHRVRILPATLGEFAGALGAAWNAMKMTTEKITGEPPSPRI